MLLVAGSFGPAAAALILSIARAGWARTRRELASRATWRHPMGLWVVALAGPAAIMLVAIGLCTVAGRPVVGWQDPARLYLVVPVFLYVAVLGGPLGEEAGWRGYALPRLQRDHSPTTAALVVGLVWGLWHAPLFAIQGTVQSSVPVAAFGVQILITSVLYAWLWNRTTSLPVVIAFHAAFNTSVGLLPVLPRDRGFRRRLCGPPSRSRGSSPASSSSRPVAGSACRRRRRRRGAGDGPAGHGSPAGEHRSSTGEAARSRAGRVRR